MVLIPLGSNNNWRGRVWGFLVIRHRRGVELVLSVESGGVVRIRRDERVAELRPTLIIYSTVSARSDIYPVQPGSLVQLDDAQSMLS
jgi:hypothetical protein